VDDKGAQTIAMHPLSGFQYAAEIPGGQLTPGTLRYHIVVRGPGGRPTTFPSEIKAFPTDWDFYGEGWNARVVPATAPILLFDAATDAPFITADHRDVKYEIVPSDRPGLSAMAVVARDLDQGEHDHSFRFYFKDKIRGRTGRLATAKKIMLFGRSTTGRSCPLQLALVTADGIAYGGMATIDPANGTYAVPISSLRQVRSPNIPHGYPVFIHFWSSPHARIPLDLGSVESVLVSIGPGLSAADYPQVHGVQIERIWLE
jgi:hypothetical protein